MKKIFAILFLVVVLFAIWKIFGNKKEETVSDKQEPLRTTAHSGIFNQSISTVVNNYLDLTALFVNDDSVKIKTGIAKFVNSVDSIKMDELKKDTSALYSTVVAQLGDIKSNALAIASDSTLGEMRRDYKMVSENLYPLLKTIGYKGQKLYFQNCPMAFGEGNDASWISNNKEIMNPYMGKHNPEFKSAMLHCGETKDTIK